jgi:hypothetical protein
MEVTSRIQARRGNGADKLAPPLLASLPALVLLLLPRPCFAAGGAFAGTLGALPDMGVILAPWSSLPLRPIGHWASPGRIGSAPSGGFFLGVETGVSLALASGDDPAQHAWAFGGRAGYELPNGLAVQLRYDYLGLSPHLTDPPLAHTQIGSAGVRYSIPFLIPLPFFEALWGPAFHGDKVSIAGALGIGGSVPIGRHVRIDASVRDWITPIEDQAHQILTFELGVSLSFASPHR